MIDSIQESRFDELRRQEQAKAKAKPRSTNRLPAKNNRRGKESVCLVGERTEPVKKELPEITVYSESGYAEARLANVVAAIETEVLNNPAGFQLYYDKFYGQIFYKNAAPTDLDAVPEPFTDASYASLRLYIEENYKFQSITDRDLKAAVLQIAHKYETDAAIEWIKSIKWDGVERVNTFLTDYFGCPVDTYHRGVARYIWTALAARCSTPGHKADAIPVLVGTQGLRKTTAIEAMAPKPEWFSPVKYHSSNNDRIRMMRGRLVQEFGELSGLRKSERADFKEFASTRVEHFVDKFDKFTTAFPRRALIIGSTNEDDFIDDPTGSRRWLPFYVEREIDTDALRDNVEQLWAEGYKLFTELRDVDWSVTLISEDHNRQFADTDPWLDRIGRWLSANSAAPFYCWRDFSKTSLGEQMIDDLRSHKAAAMKFSDAMKKLGFGRKLDRRCSGGSGKDYVHNSKSRSLVSEYAEHDAAEPLGITGDGN